MKTPLIFYRFLKINMAIQDSINVINRYEESYRMMGLNKLTKIDAVIKALKPDEHTKS